MLVVSVGLILLLVIEPRLRQIPMLVSVLFCVLTTFIFYKMYKNGLVLDQTAIRYTHPFRKTTVIPWVEVHSAAMEVHYHGHGASRHLIIRGMNNSQVSLQTGFYSRHSLQLISEILVAKAPQADISDRVKNMAEGRFPWYIF
jgi:hypothetical protein